MMMLKMKQIALVHVDFGDAAILLMMAKTRHRLLLLLPAVAAARTAVSSRQHYCT
jgi:hypothetical protein